MTATTRTHLLALALACALTACAGNDNQAGDDGSPPASDAATGAAAGTNAGTDAATGTAPGNTGDPNQPNAAITDTGATADGMATTGPVDDQRFYTLALAGGVAEIAAGKLAQQKSKNEAIRKFGEQLIRDHTAANEKMAAASGQPAMPPPDPMHQRAMEKLQALDGDAFDRAWLEQMDKDHAMTIALFENATRSEQTSQQTKDLAQANLPVLRDHAQTVRRLMQEGVARR